MRHIGRVNGTTDRDFFPTAPLATIGLLRSYPVPKRILEPCAGPGWISKTLIENGHEVVSTDLYKYDDPMVPVDFGHDFLTLPKQDVDGVITNPPYKSGLPLKMLKRSLALYDFTAFFCRLTFLETPDRGNFFKENPMAKCLIMSRRVQAGEKYFKTLEDQMGGMVCYAWFIWDKNAESRNELDFVDVKDFVPKSNLEEFMQ